MHSLRQKRKSIAILVIVALSTFSITAPAHAAMVNTAEILKQNQHNLACERINMFLDRSEVQKHLVAWGVNPEEAKARVDSLTDQEIEKIADRIDQLPAGGVLGAIVGAALIIFIPKSCN